MYPGNIAKMVRERLPGSSLFYLFMKKFLIFILFLLLLILSEYFLLNELFAQKRIFILLPSLVITVLCIYAVIKFFKKYILPVKQTEAHS